MMQMSLGKKGLNVMGIPDASADSRLGLAWGQQGVTIICKLSEGEKGAHPPLKRPEKEGSFQPVVRALIWERKHPPHSWQSALSNVHTHRISPISPRIHR